MRRCGKRKIWKRESRVPGAIRSVKNSEEIFEPGEYLTIIQGSHGEHNVILSSICIYITHLKILV